MVLDGRKTAERILERLKPLVVKRDVPLQLAAVLVGDDPALKKFVGLKKKAAETIGAQLSSYAFGDQVSQQELVDDIAWLSADDTVHGIIVELPLPGRFDTAVVTGAIALEKDIDVLSPAAQERYYADKLSILPPSVQALKTVFEQERIEPRGKSAVVFGGGMLVGAPIAHWLSRQGARVSTIDEHTKDPARISMEADIIISGVGKPGLITSDMIRDGAVVVDYGYPVQSNSADRHPPVGGKGRTLYGTNGKRGFGDVDFDSVLHKASFITPVPGGMGPVVIAAMLENLAAVVK